MVAVTVVDLAVCNSTPSAKSKSHLCSELQMQGRAQDGSWQGEGRWAAHADLLIGVGRSKGGDAAWQEALEH